MSDGGLGTKVGTGFPSASVWLRLGRLIFLRTDALLDPLRKEPRFRAIERRLGFRTDNDVNGARGTLRGQLRLTAFGGFIAYPSMSAPGSITASAK